MFGALPAIGDWITLTKQVPISWSDTLTNDGLPPGTRGVVTDRSGGRVHVDLDSGFGTVRATVRDRDIRVVRRHGGVAEFQSRTHATTAIRAGVAVALLTPFLFFITQYVWLHHSTKGLLTALASGIVLGALDMVGAAITHPVETLIYLVVVGAVSRWTFRR